MISTQLQWFFWAHTMPTCYVRTVKCNEQWATRNWGETSDVLVIEAAKGIRAKWFNFKRLYFFFLVAFRFFCLRCNFSFFSLRSFVSVAICFFFFLSEDEAEKSSSICLAFSFRFVVVFALTFDRILHRFNEFRTLSHIISIRFFLFVFFSFASQFDFHATFCVYKKNDKMWMIWRFEFTIRNDWVAKMVMNSSKWFDFFSFLFDSNCIELPLDSRL